MAKSKKSGSTAIERALQDLEINRLREQLAATGLIGSVQDALGNSNVHAAFANLPEHHGVLEAIQEQQQIAKRISALMSPMSHLSQLSQIKERLGIFDTLDRMQALGMQPSVIQAMNDLQESIGFRKLDPNPIGRFNLTALNALNDHMREFYGATSLKFTALESVSLARGFDSPAFAEARLSLLGRWHSRPDLTDRFFTESDYRAGVYQEHGVDRGLINAPPEVAVELMIESGFLPGDLDEEEAVARLVVGSVSMEIRSSDPTQGARKALDHIELRLRAIIAEKLEATHGEHWFTLCAPPDVVTNARRKRNSGLKGGEKNAPLVHWTDLGDLMKIVISKKNWPSAFANLFADRQRFEADMLSLITFRRPAAHARPIDSTRLAELLLIAQRLETWIKEDGIWKRDADENG